MKSIHLMTACFALIIGFTSCNSNEYSEFADVPAYTIKNNTPVQISVEVEESGKTFEAFVELRHTTMIPYANIPLVIVIDGPDGFTNEQQIDVPLRDENGRLVGSAMGDLVDSRVQFSSGLTLGSAGTYVFKVKPSTTKEIDNLLEIGILLKGKNE